MLRVLPFTAIVAVFVVIVGVLGSCSGSGAAELPRQDLFNVSLGKMDDAVDIFSVNGIQSSRKNRVFMRNGLISLGNGNSDKVIRFSSYGALLALYYNPQENPKPMLAGSDRSSSEKSTNKIASPYPFQDVGEIAMLRSGMMLIEDKTPDARKINDSTLNTQLSRVVLRFNTKGEYQDYLGQQGIGGDPFPWIAALWVTVNDDIVVISRTEDVWLVYWFNAQGVRKGYAQIGREELPIPDSGSWVPNIVGIQADPESYRVFLDIDYYAAGAENSEVQSRVWALDMANLTYGSWFTLPSEKMPLPAATEFEPREVQSLYRVIGMSIGGRIYAIARKDEGKQYLAIFDVDGRLLDKKTLLIEDNLVDTQYHVSFEGVLTGFLAYPDHATVAWWRSDKLFGTGLTGY